MNSGALDKIRMVRQRYILYLLLTDACYSAAFALAGALVLNISFNTPLFSALLLLPVAFGIFTFRHRVWLVNNASVTSFLDSHYPELEESSVLLLMQPAELNLLQQIQVSKIAEVIRQIPPGQKQFKRRLNLSTIWLISTLVLAVLISRLNYHRVFDGIAPGKKANTANNVKENILPQVQSVTIVITPPSYTHISERRQEKFNLETVEGAVTGWTLKTNVPVKKVSLLFNEQESLSMESSGKDKTQWMVKKTISRPGFYQVVIDGKRSDLYEVQVIKDLPPVIQIKAPRQYTYIDAGEKPQVNVEAIVNDDYGVNDAMIYATIAKGSGEAVKFKEQTINFGADFSKKLRSYNLRKTIDLPALGMEPGDELYLYVQAHDNNAHISRTDVYIVAIQDTAQLLSMDGILSGVNIKPEYFRSERQIILDAESLLKEKDTISQEKFKDRSNDLGTDQKLLRLRYGKFLGEEAEENIGDPRLEGNDKVADPKDFGNGAKILDEYTDKHDNAEDAQFFDPTIKAQLKATLTEMWKAELQLRLYKPQDALPFAYKALRLLKDLQQKSRSYVAKTAYNPSPLKMEKRLSGDLDKILQPSDHLDIKQEEGQFAELKSAATLLQQISYLKVLNSNNYRLLQAASQKIGERAAVQPGIYLPAASAMRRIMAGDKKNMASDIAIVERAIQKILPLVPSLPQPASSGADMGFSKAYFSKLHANR